MAALITRSFVFETGICLLEAFSKGTFPPSKTISAAGLVQASARGPANPFPLGFEAAVWDSLHHLRAEQYGLRYGAW